MDNFTIHTDRTQFIPKSAVHTPDNFTGCSGGLREQFADPRRTIASRLVDGLSRIGEFFRGGKNSDQVITYGSVIVDLSLPRPEFTPTDIKTVERTVFHENGIPIAPSPSKRKR